MNLLGHLISVGYLNPCIYDLMCYYMAQLMHSMATFNNVLINDLIMVGLFDIIGLKKSDGSLDMVGPIEPVLVIKNGSVI